jgi:indolepyruvate ferredoxin oxidoreductase alpha subunit
VLNVTYPLVPAEIAGFAAGKRALLVLEEGQRVHREDIVQALRRLDVQTPCTARTCCPAGEYTVEVIARPAGLLRTLAAAARPDAGARLAGRQRGAPRRHREDSAPARAPAGLCASSAPERPVFAALKLAQQRSAGAHRADIGCHALATFEPFSSGHSILGYGMSLASRAGVSPMMQRRSWPSWATAASGTTACSPACRRRSSTATTRCSSS